MPSLVNDCVPMDNHMARNLLLQHEKEIQALALTTYKLKIQLNLIQDTIMLDSTRWEIKQGTIYAEKISNIIIQNETDKTRILAYVVNGQLHDIRDAISTGDKKLKEKDRVVEFLTHQGRHLNSGGHHSDSNRCAFTPFD